MRSRIAAAVVVLALSGCGTLLTDADAPSFANIDLALLLTNPSYAPPGPIAAALAWSPGASATAPRISQPVAFQATDFRGQLSIDALPPEAAMSNGTAAARIVLFADLDGNGRPTPIEAGATSLEGTEPVVGSPEDIYVTYVEGTPPGASAPASGGATGLLPGFNLVQTLAAPPSGCVGAACCELTARSTVAWSMPQHTTVPAGDAASRFLCNTSTAVAPAITSCAAQTWSACEGCAAFPVAAVGEPLTCAADARSYAIAHFAASFDPTLGPICGADASATVQVTSLAEGAAAPDGWPCP